MSAKLITAVVVTVVVLLVCKVGGEANPNPNAVADANADVFKLDRSSLPGPEFKIGGLPLFDEHTNGLLILRHRFVLKFQLRCILLGAPCDVIGRWLKPRIERVLLENTCEQCTPTQKQLVKKWINVFAEQYPDLWRASMAKYAENLGIPLPPDEKRKMIQVLGTYP